MSKNTINKNIETNTNNINILNNTIKTLLDHIYPVGSIYMNINSIDPNTTLGGTWERICDRFLIGGGKDYTVGATGGEKEHKLTVAEMPQHRHDFNAYTHNDTKIQFFNADSANGGSWIYDNQFMVAAKRNQASTSFPDVLTQSNLLIAPIASTGSSVAHNNIPPYLSVCIWKRTA